VAQQLKLSPRQVRALETDDFTRLPGRTFVRGFVRNYARLVALDPELVLGALPGGAETPTLVAPTLHPTAPTIGELPTSERTKAPWTRWAIPLSLAAIVAIAARLRVGAACGREPGASVDPGKQCGESPFDDAARRGQSRYAAAESRLQHRRGRAESGCDAAAPAQGAVPSSPAPGARRRAAVARDCPCEGRDERVLMGARPKNAMATTLTAVRGMNDVLPADAPLWERLEDTARQVFGQYGYGNIRVPIVEIDAALRARHRRCHRHRRARDVHVRGQAQWREPDAASRGDRGHRACGNRALAHYERPQRVWTAGPMFRHERPQRGRYRQFHQLNVEALGFPGPDVDAEHMVMLSRLWKALGTVRGHAAPHQFDRRCRRAPRASRDLIAYFEQHAARLDADAKRRLHTNPLRILDSKNPEMHEIVQGAPQLLGRLSGASRAHFDSLQQILADNGVAFEINPRLVRGLDYYNRTVFEWVTDRLGNQIAVAGRRALRRAVREPARQAHAGEPAFAIGNGAIVLLLQEAGCSGGSRSARVRRARRRRAARLAWRGRGDASRRGMAPSSSMPAAAASSRR
jgi:histidyl-tRNA synthetase